MKQLLCLLMGMLAASCGNSPDTPYKTPVASARFAEHAEQAGKKDGVWEQLLLSLERDGFTLTIDSAAADSLRFERYDEVLAPVESLVLRPASSRTLTAKARVPLAGTALYPRFRIRDVSFAENPLPDSLVERIESIMYSADPINEKVYDRIILLAPDRFLYLSTEAKAFSETVDRYADSIAHFSTTHR